MRISEVTRDLLLAQWDITNGLRGVDPFGSLASAQAILQAQTSSVAQLKLQQQLIGQTEAAKRRAHKLLAQGRWRCFDRINHQQEGVNTMKLTSVLTAAALVAARRSQRGVLCRGGRGA